MTSKIFLKSEKEDKKITFKTDEDQSLRDFYWRYARGLEKVDTQKNTPSKVKQPKILTPKKEKV